MANTYSQVHLQFIFATRYRNGLIQPSWEDKLYRYISGIVSANNHKMIIANGMPDHIHLLVGFRTTQSIADLMQDVKAGSSKWVNDNAFTRGRFEWQSGYAVFSYAKSDLENVIRYIQNQKEHHKKEKFLDECRLLLTEFEVPYNEAYLFKTPE